MTRAARRTKIGSWCMQKSSNDSYGLRITFGTTEVLQLSEAGVVLAFLARAAAIRTCAVAGLGFAGNFWFVGELVEAVD